MFSRYIKSTVAKLAKLFPVVQVAEVFAANVGPVKISLLTFRDLTKSAHLTETGFTKSTFNPLVLRSVSGATTLPKVVLTLSIREAVTIFGTIKSFFLRSTDLKRITTLLTSLLHPATALQSTAGNGTS